MTKKLLLLFAMSTILSCNTNENNNVNTKVNNICLTTIINGNKTNFDKYNVVKEIVNPENGDPSYTDLIVTFGIKADKNKIIVLRSAYLETGTKTCYYSSYYDYSEGVDYDLEVTDNSFIVDIITNEEHHFKGTFSGTLKDRNSAKTVLIEGGDFDILY